MKALQNLAAALALAGLCSAAAAAGNLVVSPAAAQAQPGDLVVVDIRGAGFTDNVVGGGFDLSFNAAVLSLTSVVIDNVEWDFLTHPGTIDNTAGTLTGVWFNAFAAPLPTGDFPIARLSFSALAEGFSALNLMANASFPFVNDAAELIAVTYGSGGVAVTAVPELATWEAMPLGLAALLWLRRRRLPVA
jgi:hypothetical protein